jgi:hypothetical protein
LIDRVPHTKASQKEATQSRNTGHEVSRLLVRDIARPDKKGSDCRATKDKDVLAPHEYCESPQAARNGRETASCLTKKQHAFEFFA